MPALRFAISQGANNIVERAIEVQFAMLDGKESSAPDEAGSASPNQSRADGVRVFLFSLFTLRINFFLDT